MTESMDPTAADFYAKYDDLATRAIAEAMRLESQVESQEREAETLRLGLISRGVPRSARKRGLRVLSNMRKETRRRIVSLKNMAERAKQSKKTSGMSKDVYDAFANEFKEIFG